MDTCAGEPANLVGELGDRRDVMYLRESLW